MPASITSVSAATTTTAIRIRRVRRRERNGHAFLCRVPLTAKPVHDARIGELRTTETFEGEVKGVLELASFQPFTPIKLSLIDQLMESLGIVMAAANYPASPRSGDAIEGLDRPLPDGCKVFHAGTRDDGGTVLP